MNRSVHGFLLTSTRSPTLVRRQECRFQVIRVCVIAATSLLIAQACESPTSVTSPLIETGQRSYTLIPSNDGLATAIDYVFTNRTGGAVYIPNCNGAFPITLERKDGGEWREVWAPVLFACLSPPIVVEPGASFSDTLQVWGALPGASTPMQFDREDPSGVYRMVWKDVVSSYDRDQYPFGTEIAKEYRVSNAFDLVVSGALPR